MLDTTLQRKHAENFSLYRKSTHKNPHLDAGRFSGVARLDGRHQRAQLVQDLWGQLAGVHAPEQRANLLAVVVRLALLPRVCARIGDEALHEVAQSRDDDLVLRRHLQVAVTVAQRIS